jgi:Predicted membrane protein (DUF2127)
MRTKVSSRCRYRPEFRAALRSLSTSAGVKCSRDRRSAFDLRRGGGTFPFLAVGSSPGEGLKWLILLQDPRDAIANYILRSAQSLSIDQKSAAAFFLFSHGIVKLFLIVAVLRNKPWAYPAFMTALGLPISYQSYKLLHVLLALQRFGPDCIGAQHRAPTGYPHHTSTLGVESARISVDDPESGITNSEPRGPPKKSPAGSCSSPREICGTLPSPSVLFCARRSQRPSSPQV